MFRFSNPRDGLGLLVGTCLLALLAAPADASNALHTLLDQAQAREAAGDWDRACDLYEAALRHQRDQPAVKERYGFCLRRLWQVRRHRDVQFHKEVLSADYGQALHLYALVRDTLLDNSLQRKELDAGKLFRKGLEEFESALGDPTFRALHIPSDRLAQVPAVRALLARHRSGSAVSRQDTLKQVREIALAAQSKLRLNSTVVVIEFLCGACHSLDEYSAYLTPGQLRELCQSLKGEAVGVGLGLAEEGHRVLVESVAEGSSAAEASLRPNDQVVSVDRRPVAPFGIDAVRQLLEGPVGSTVELEILSAGMVVRTVQLRRRPLFVPSVDAFMLPDSSVGYLKLSCFQDTTVKEIDAALGGLSEAGMKALVLDLRGNGGGLFDAAVETARRFLPTGVIASTQHQDVRQSFVYHARNASALALPVVVLIDGDTASAAEVLAGALKENGRAILVGQTSFGKGCTQCLLKLPNLNGLPTGGLRVTVARFLSPKGTPYTGRGVVPDLIVERNALSEEPMPGAYDPEFVAAFAEAERQLALAMR